MPWESYRPNPGLITLEFVADSSVVCFIEKLDGWGGLSMSLNNYLLQQNEINHD